MLQRTTVVKLYKFEELSPEAQERALTRAREGFYDCPPEWWTDFLVEGINGGGGDDDLSEKGVQIQLVTETYSVARQSGTKTREHHGLLFSLDYSHSLYCDFEKPEIVDMEKFMEFMHFTPGLRNAVRDSAVNVYFTKNKNWARDYDRSEIEFERADGVCTMEVRNLTKNFLKQEEAANDWWQDYKRHCLTMLEQEYAYQQSDESLIENMDANEWTFYESGELAKSAYWLKTQGQGEVTEVPVPTKLVINFYTAYHGGHPFSEAEELDSPSNSGELEQRCQALANLWGTLVYAYESGSTEHICWAEPKEVTSA